MYLGKLKKIDVQSTFRVWRMERIGKVVFHKKNKVNLRKFEKIRLMQKLEKFLF